MTNLERTAHPLRTVNDMTQDITPPGFSKLGNSDTSMFLSKTERNDTNVFGQTQTALAEIYLSNSALFGTGTVLVVEYYT